MDLRGGLLINGQPGTPGQSPTRQPDGSLAWGGISVSLAGPTGWTAQSTNTNGSVSLTFALPAGQALLAAADKTVWDAAAVLAGTAVQPAALTSAFTDHLAAQSHLTSSQVRQLFSGTRPLSYNPVTGALSWAATGLSFEQTGNSLNFISLVPQTQPPSTPASGFTVFSDANGRFSWVGANGFARTFDATGITAPRVWVPPNRSGSLALTDDYQPFAYRDDATPLTASQTVALLTMPWPSTDEVWALPRWTLLTAPSGAACVFDIQRLISGVWTSIYSTMPQIAVGATSSDGTAGTFSATFAASPRFESQMSIRFMCTQIGTGSGTAAGAGLRWNVPVRAVYG